VKLDLRGTRVTPAGVADLSNSIGSWEITY
jgi:hypothetical protein